MSLRQRFLIWKARVYHKWFNVLMVWLHWRAYR
jgi:hypothetical protein